MLYLPKYMQCNEYRVLLSACIQNTVHVIVTCEYHMTHSCSHSLTSKRNFMYESVFLVVCVFTTNFRYLSGSRPTQLSSPTGLSLRCSVRQVCLMECATLYLVVVQTLVTQSPAPPTWQPSPSLEERSECLIHNTKSIL